MSGMCSGASPPVTSTAVALRIPGICSAFSPVTSMGGALAKRDAVGNFTYRYCDYKTTRKRNLTSHLVNEHDIGVEWHPCTQAGCDFKAKQKRNLTRHLARKHDIGVAWHSCTQPGCGYMAKLKAHLEAPRVQAQHRRGMAPLHPAGMKRLLSLDAVIEQATDPNLHGRTCTGWTPRL